MYIETKRLILRSFKEGDAGQALVYLGDAEVMAHVEPAFDLDKTTWFIRQFGLCDHPAVFAVCLKEDGGLIGHAIFHPFEGRRDLYEIGWILSRSAWGCGYAREITCALTSYGSSIGIKGYIIEASPQNKRAFRAAEATGAVYIGEKDGLSLFLIGHKE